MDFNQGGGQVRFWDPNKLDQYSRISLILIHRLPLKTLEVDRQIGEPMDKFSRMDTSVL